MEFFRSGTEVLPRLTAAGAARPGLLLLDLNMPGESGLDVIRNIRSHRNLDGLTIVVSGRAGSVVGGNPARVIGSYDDLADRVKTWTTRREVDPEFRPYL